MQAEFVDTCVRLLWLEVLNYRAALRIFESLDGVGVGVGDVVRQTHRLRRLRITACRRCLSFDELRSVAAKRGRLGIRRDHQPVAPQRPTPRQYPPVKSKLCSRARQMRALTWPSSTA